MLGTGTVQNTLHWLSQLDKSHPYTCTVFLFSCAMRALAIGGYDMTSHSLATGHDGPLCGSAPCIYLRWFDFSRRCTSR